MGRKVSKGSASVELPAKADRGLVILRAMHAYMARRDVALRTVWENERVDAADPLSPLIQDSIPYSTLLAHANAARWGKRRELIWAQIETEALRQLQTDLTQARVRELQMLQAAAEVVRNSIFGVPDPSNPGAMLVAPAKPRSLEGMVNALVRLDAHIQGKREGIADVMIEAADRLAAGRDVIDSDEAPLGPAMDDAFSDEEIREFAKFMAQRRADASRKAMRKLRGMEPADEE